MGTRIIGSNIFYHHYKYGEGPDDYRFILLYGGKTASLDPTIRHSKSIFFAEGMDCCYYDVYKYSNLTDIGREKNVIHDSIYLDGSVAVDASDPHLIYRDVVDIDCFQLSGSYPPPMKRDKEIHRKRWWKNGSDFWYSYQYRSFSGYYDTLKEEWHVQHIHTFLDKENDMALTWELEEWKISRSPSWSRYQGNFYDEYTQVMFADEAVYTYTGCFTRHSWVEVNSVVIDDPDLPSFSSIREFHDEPTGLASELSRQALDKLKCNTNNIANIISAVSLCKAIKNPTRFPQLLKDIKSCRFGKAAANSWLKYRYVYKTTLSDIQEIARRIQQSSNPSLILREGTVHNKGTMHVKIVTNLLTDLSQFGKLQKLGIDPSLYNLWDLVPFSFVADWFCDIGDVLEDLASQQWAANFSIQSCTISWSWTHSVHSNVLGPVTYKHYARLVTCSAPSFVPYSTGPSDSTIIKRIIDGIALLVG